MKTLPGSARALSLVLCMLCAPGGASAQEQHAGWDSGEQAPAPESASAARAGRVLSISRQETKDGPRWSVLCEEAPLEELLRALARKAGLALEGSQMLPVGAEVTVQLERRPLDQVLAFLLGSQGLSHELVRGTLRLAPASHEPAALLRLAQDAWKTVEAEGDPQAAVRAKLAQGNLAEVRGDLEGAYHIYAELSEEGLSDDAAEATYRAGRILERLGHWAEAAQHFRALANLDSAPRFHARARLELARVSIELGDAKSALHLLNFLDSNYATQDAEERCERRLVRARAFNATHQYVEALRTLEQGPISSAPEGQARSLAIRAEAFEGLGFEVEAARAWLIFARESVSPEERTSAFGKAAVLSLAGGDELGTLFVCREAAKSGDDEGLGTFGHQARLRLGLDEEEAPSTMLERLELAESLLADTEIDRASELFEGLYLARGALPEPEQARILAGWSRILLPRAGLEAAIEVLSKARAVFEDPLAARTLDLSAAALFESEGRYEEAAEAYRGDY